VEISIDVRSLPEFLALLDTYKEVVSRDSVDKLGSDILLDGCREPLTGRRIWPDELSAGTDWREGLASAGISSRVRAVMRCIEMFNDEQGLHSPRIYAAEGLTHFALRLRGLYPRFVGSEYTTDPQRKTWMYPIPCEDLQQLSMPSNSFDIVSTNEVLEHVPSIDRALGEIFRVLRPGGWHFGTVPFFFFNETGQRRAMLDQSGKLLHLMEPEFHGDPMNDGGALVFEIPGWDIVDRARNAGFSDAFMRFMISTSHGILSEHIGGILVFCCKK
jgi:SAM-dependent methyltransferase